MEDIDIAKHRRRLKRAIKQRSLSFGEFELASGKRSNYFIDCKQVTLSGPELNDLAILILDEIHADDIDAVGGMTLGADPIVGGTIAIAAQFDISLRGFIVRKERKDRGMGDQVAGVVGDGDRVAMLEDVVTTGGMTIKAIDAVNREYDVQIAKVITVVDRMQGAREAIEGRGFDLTALFTVQQLGVTPQ